MLQWVLQPLFSKGPNKSGHWSADILQKPSSASRLRGTNLLLLYQQPKFSRKNALEILTLWTSTADVLSISYSKLAVVLRVRNYLDIFGILNVRNIVLDAPAKLGKILVGMNKALGEIPVTVKLRTGVKDGRNTAHKLMPRLAAEWGAASLTVWTFSYHLTTN